MPLDLTGITNESEFYTDYYMNSILEEDLRPVFARWTGALESPIESLRRVGAAWAQMRADLEETSDPAARLECQRGWLRDCVAALGYTWDAGARESEDGLSIPLAGEITDSHGAPELWLMEALDPTNELADPLALPIVREQLPAGDDLRWTEEATFEDVITDGVFGGEE